MREPLREPLQIPDFSSFSFLKNDFSSESRLTTSSSRASPSPFYWCLLEYQSCHAVCLVGGCCSGEISRTAVRIVCFCCPRTVDPFGLCLWRSIETTSELWRIRKALDAVQSPFFHLSAIFFRRHQQSLAFVHSSDCQPLRGQASYTKAGHVQPAGRLRERLQTEQCYSRRKFDNRLRRKMALISGGFFRQTCKPVAGQTQRKRWGLQATISCGAGTGQESNRL